MAASSSTGGVSSEATDDAPMALEETLRIGSVVAFACHNPETKVYSWHCGRVQKMLRKSAGKRGNYTVFTEPMLYLDAVASKVKVVCIWYRRDARVRGYTFTYDGEDDTREYSLENALALAPLEIPRRERYDLLDPTQGPRLDAALELTKPTEKPGSKRTKGEEAAAAKARVQRQQYRPADLGMRAPSGKARAPPTARVRT